MKIALLGFPQAGKKTLFSLLTGRRVPESRKPAEALEGIAPIRDPRVDALSAICKPQRTVYAENRFVLCPDVSIGEGNRDWLNAACRCDLLCLVLRGFESAQVYHPAGSVDAQRDRTQIEGELMLADMELVEKRLARMEKEKRGGQTPAQALEEKTLQKCMQALDAGKRLSETPMTEQEVASILSLDLVTRIPLMCVYNVSEAQVGQSFGPGSLAISALIEEEISRLEDPAERKEYMATMGLSSAGLDRMNQAAYDALGLMSFYTIGEDEVRAWTIRKGSPAPVAGGKVHTDIERGFIRAEVIKYEHLVAAGSERAAKDQGRLQTRGRDYIIEDGDICNFLFNV